MTVADIQEYIDSTIQESEQVGMSGYDCALYLKNSMRTIMSMLDELEPNENNTLALFANTLDAHIGTHNEIINIEMTQEQALRLKKAIEYLTEAITKEYYND